MLSTCLLHSLLVRAYGSYLRLGTNHLVIQFEKEVSSYRCLIGPATLPYSQSLYICLRNNCIIACSQPLIVTCCLSVLHDGGSSKCKPQNKHTHVPHTHTHKKGAELVGNSWTSVRDGKGFQPPPHFSWRPCDETKGGGRKPNALCDVCVCVCVIHVSCLGLTASLSCVNSFFRLWFGLQLVCFFIDPCLLCTRTFPLSGSGSLSWISLHLCCFEMFRVGLFPSSDCVAGAVGRVCLFFVNLQSCMESVVCLAESRLIVVCR